MKRLGRFKITHAVCAIAIVLLATSAGWAGLCDAILEKGVFGRSFFTSSVSLGEDLLQVACDRHFLSQSDASNFTGSVGLGDVLKVAFGSDSKKWKQTYDEVCKSTSLRRTYSERIQQELIFADPVLVQGWVECLRLNSTGVRSWIEWTSDVDWVLHVEYLKCHSSAPSAAKVTSFSIAGGSCSQPLKKNSLIRAGVGAGVALLCTRPTAESDVTVVINTNLGPTTARLMGVEPPPPPTCFEYTIESPTYIPGSWWGVGSCVTQNLGPDPIILLEGAVLDEWKGVLDPFGRRILTAGQSFRPGWRPGPAEHPAACLVRIEGPAAANFTVTFDWNDQTGGGSRITSVAGVELSRRQVPCQ